MFSTASNESEEAMSLHLTIDALDRELASRDAGGRVHASPYIRDWRELASRETGGLEVFLLWSKSADRVKVVLADSRLDEQFELDVAGADALAAFHHPFAFAAAEGMTFDADRESIDLQPQS
jgi:hypothetical protein